MTQKLIKEQVQFSLCASCPVSHHPILFKNIDEDSKDSMLQEYKIFHDALSEIFNSNQLSFLKWTFLNPNKPICFDYQPYKLLDFNPLIKNEKGIASFVVAIETFNGNFDNLVLKQIEKNIISTIVETNKKHGTQLSYMKYDVYRKYEISDIEFME